MRGCPPHQLLIELDIKSARDLLGNLAAAKARIAPFDFDNRVDKFP